MGEHVCHREDSGVSAVLHLVAARSLSMYCSNSCRKLGHRDREGQLSFQASIW